MKSGSEPQPVRLFPVQVWDLPVRLIHWALVFLVLLSWWSAENDFQNVHVLSGYGVLTLVLVRLYWGISGSASARFAHFVRRPRVIFAYSRQIFKRPGVVSAGHNPMGALSVVVLLALLLAQPILGLLAKDIDGLHSGPLSHLVSFKVGRLIAEVHHLTFELLLIFVVLHIAVVTFYVFYKRDGIISAMISGCKKLPHRSGEGLFFVPGRRAAIALGVVVALVLSLHFFASIS